MVKWLSRFFFYLDRYFIALRSLPPLNDVGLLCFRKLVYEEINVRAREAVISLINQEREGEQIDRALLKNVLAIFVDIGMVNMEYYVNDFEAELLSDTAGYYTRKASNWIQEDSCPEYMIKAEECLKREKDRVTHYLHSSTEEKLIEQVQEQLLSKVSQQLLEKEHFGCYVLLREDKTEDLTRIYNLFSKISKGLYPVSLMFKQVSLFSLLVIIITCFDGHTLFHKVFYGTTITPTKYVFFSFISAFERTRSRAISNFLCGTVSKFRSNKDRSWNC
ncbi:hypothetical protein MKW92_019682 [Papaver armeniacum]|nr:hypothetical protein MKW92_019682 [Papaver armeniacum]